MSPEILVKMLKVELLPYDAVTECEHNAGIVATSFGNCRVEFVGDAVVEVSFVSVSESCVVCRNSSRFGYGQPQKVYGGVVTAAGDSVADKRAEKVLRAFFDNEGEVRVAVKCSRFAETVFVTLLSVAFGDKVSYEELARRAGVPKAVRAVASAVASNRVGLLIPCHRVIRKNGDTGRYRWGEKLKKELLDWEREKSVTLRYSI